MGQRNPLKSCLFRIFSKYQPQILWILVFPLIVLNCNKHHFNDGPLCTVLCAPYSRITSAIMSLMWLV